MTPPTLIPGPLNNEINLHIEKIKAELEPGTAILIGGNVNIFYATGRFFRGYVYLPKEGKPQYFIIKPQIYEESPAAAYIRKPEQIPDILAERGISLPKAIGLEEDILPYSDILRLMRLFPEAEFFNSSPALRKARMVKTPYEIGRMIIDGQKQVKVYSQISGLYREGMTDLDLQIAIESKLRQEGCLGYARVSGNLMEINMGSVLAGENADNPSPYEFAMGGEGTDMSLPGGANGTPIRRGETVMVDMNGAFNAYQTDMTRVWSLGDLPAIAIQAQNCAKEILSTLERETRPGMEACDLYFRAVEIADKAGLKEYFMGHRQKSNFIGHGVGIELNEQPPIAPRCKTMLLEGMTIALEPKFVLPGVGAVGVENTYVIRAEGLESLTPYKEDIIEFIR